MSRHVKYPSANLGVKQLDINFRWYPNGTSAISTVYGRGVGAIEYVSTGTYKITLDERYNKILKFHNTRAAGTATAASESQVTVLADVASGNTASTYVTFRYTVTSTSTTVAASTSDFFLTSITAENSTVDD